MCEKCGKGAMKAIKRSHSHRASIRRQKPNLQNKTMDGKKMLLCTSCIKTITKKA